MPSLPSVMVTVKKLNKSPCSTRAAVQSSCWELRPSLHWKGLLFIARASRLYRPRPRALPRGHWELLKLLLVTTGLGFHTRSTLTTPGSGLQPLEAAWAAQALPGIGWLNEPPTRVLQDWMLCLGCGGAQGQHCSPPSVLLPGAHSAMASYKRPSFSALHVIPSACCFSWPRPRTSGIWGLVCSIFQMLYNTQGMLFRQKSVTEDMLCKFATYHVIYTQSYLICYIACQERKWNRKIMGIYHFWAVSYHNMIMQSSLVINFL